MKVFIVGLGLMGGAYAYRLCNKGYEIYACDHKQSSIDFALERHWILDGDVNPERFIRESDIIILAFYPQAIIDFIKQYKHLFREGQIITDICGVKTDFIQEATKLSLPAIYCSHHPMAGREKVGVEYATEVVFGGANYLVTPTENTPEDVIEIMKKMGEDLGFKRISVMDCDKHNRMIGFTSQLTHAIAVSLVNSDRDTDTKNFIGDSYRDLTRIAMINEKLWSELFLENRDYLLEHIASFEFQLNRLKMALYNEDKDGLCDLFRSSTKIRKEMEK